MGEENSQNYLKHRGSIIQSVTTPINFFTLVVLITEGILASIAYQSSPGERMFIISGMLIILIFLVISVAITAYKKPEALAGIKDKNPKPPEVEPNEESLKLCVDRDIQGETAIDDIQCAISTIHLTHFSGRTPHLDYIQSMLNRVKECSIDVTRIISKELENREWLKEFRDLGNNYKEIEVATKLDFDILVIDGKKVRLYFPATTNAQEFKKPIVFDERELAECFLTVIERFR